MGSECEWMKGLKISIAQIAEKTECLMMKLYLDQKTEFKNDLIDSQSALRIQKSPVK